MAALRMLVAGALVAAAVAGCSSDSGTGASPSASPSKTGLRTALLSPSELGTGYSESPSTGDSALLPCTPGAKPLLTQVPPVQRIKNEYANRTGTGNVEETIAQFADDSVAGRALAAGAKGFACTDGTLSGLPVRIARRAAGELTATGVDSLEAWDYTSGSVRGAEVLARIGTRLVALTVTGDDGYARLDAIVRRAVAKVVALG